MAVSHALDHASINTVRHCQIESESGSYQHSQVSKRRIHVTRVASFESSKNAEAFSTLRDLEVGQVDKLVLSHGLYSLGKDAHSRHSLTSSLSGSLAASIKIAPLRFM